MGCEFFIIGLVISILVLALVGLVTVIRALGPRPAPRHDFDATRRVVEELFANQTLSQESYAEIVAAIEQSRSTYELWGGTAPGLPAQPAALQRRPNWHAADAPRQTLRGEETVADTDSPLADFVAQPKSIPPVLGQPAPSFEQAGREIEFVEPSPLRPVPTSPWDLPDAAPAEPTRSWREIFALFMQEKNIRWGELASGILIVGSAVGLVLSLRTQLLQVIPYFPALLFLLITAAIIASGVYTLHRWRLQMTSRGILVIGLMLVPLNVLISCWLTGNQQHQRPLDDPIYWVAIFVELTSLAALSWLAAKNLLRVQYWGLVASVMGSAAYTLVVNRIADPSASVLRTALWMSPFAVFFLVAAIGIAPRMNQRFWNRREIRRLLANLGIAFFAVAVGIALFFIKWSSDSLAIAAMPVLVAASAATAWLGGLVVARPRAIHETWRLIALSIMDLGLLMAAGGIIVAQGHPTLGFAAALLAALMFFVQSRVSRSAWMSLPGMVCLAWAAAAGTMLVSGLLNETLLIDQRTTPTAFFQALVTGRTGISLLLAAGVMAFASKYFSLASAEADHLQFRNMRFVALFGIAVFGVLLAVSASFINPQSQFDAFTATALLGAIALALMAARIFQRLDRAIGTWVAALAAGLLFAALVHGCWWNATIYQALVDRLGPFSPVATALAAYALLMATATALFVRFGAMQSDEPQRTEVSNFFSWCSMGAATAAWGCAIPLMANQNGIGTGIAIALVVGWYLLAWFRKGPAESVGFALSWAIAGLFFVGEFAIRLGWYAHWADVRFLLACLAALGIWCLPWVALRRITRSSRAAALFDAGVMRPEAIIATTLGAVAVCLVGFGLAGPLCAEIASNVNVTIFEWAQVVVLWRWHAAILVLSGAAVLAGCLERITRSKMDSLVLLWLAGWALASIAFSDSRATATALRWLIAIGGLLLSIGFGYRHAIGTVWSRAARAVGLKPQWELKESQRLATIQVALTISVVLILGITAVVTTSVMVFKSWGIDGPIPNTLFGRLPKDISYAVPIALLVATCLSYGITQRRQWLAMVGSFVFQSCVVGSLILLLASSDPRIASVRFIQILQFVSIGMSVYGAIWFWQRARVELVDRERRHGSLLQVHTVVNASLMLGLTGIIFFKFWVDRQIASDWVKVIGGPVGIVAVATLIPLFIATVPSALDRYRLWLIAAFGAMAVGIAAIHVDKFSTYGVVTIGYGLVAVLAGQICAKWLNRSATGQRSALAFSGAGFAGRIPGRDFLPLGIVGFLAQSFCTHALPSHPSAAFVASELLLALALIYSFAFLSGNGLLVAYGLAILNAVNFWRFRTVFSPALSAGMDGLVQLLVLALLSVTLVALTFLLIRSKHASRMPDRSFSCLPSLAAAICSAWMLLSELFLTTMGRWSGFDSNASLAVVSMTMLIAICGLQLWNVRAQFVVPTTFLSSLATASVILHLLKVPHVELSTFLASSVVVAGWGAIRWHRDGIIDALQSLRIARTAKLRANLSRHIPLLVWTSSVLLFLVSVIGILGLEEWNLRLIAAVLPMPLALAFFYSAGRPTNESQQFVSALLFTAGCIFLSWTDLPRLSDTLTPWVLRALMILAAAVFLFGWLVPNLVRRGDTWLATLRRMTMLTTGLAIAALAFLVADQLPLGIEDSNRPLISPTDAGTALLAVAAMVSGLIAIAVRPKHDAFSFTISLRKGLVYAAQAAAVLGIIFASATIPWFLQLGLRHYWPYVLMAASIGGLLLAKLLEQRELTVLGQPLMNLAMAIPLAGAAGTLLTSTKTDAALVMLMAGSVYLIVGMVQQSMVASIAALVFGNWALYCFYDKFPQFHFLEHPQLWLIPPAVSVLIAAQFNRQRMRRTELAMLRYAALGTIYVSSTSEIFIQEMGEQLWPPIVLAVLSLGGIFAGILMQVRAFLYVGTLFLLTAMTAMVYHAARKFEHVWPWWAFGLSVGIVILVLFGLFEKRRNDLRRVASRLQTWDL